MQIQVITHIENGLVVAKDGSPLIGIADQETGNILFITGVNNKEGKAQGVAMAWIIYRILQLSQLIVYFYSAKNNKYIHSLMKQMELFDRFYEKKETL